VVLDQRQGPAALTEREQRRALLIRAEVAIWLAAAKPGDRYEYSRREPKAEVDRLGDVGLSVTDPVREDLLDELSACEARGRLRRASQFFVSP
jgi:hypothetical protein